MSKILSSSLSPIDPNLITNGGFQSIDEKIIPSETLSGSFDPTDNNIEYFIYDSLGNVVLSEYNFIDYKILGQKSVPGKTTDEVTLDPIEDVINRGFSNGKLFTVYNFINLELFSSQDNKWFIEEISGDRTEIRLKTNFVENEDIKSSFTELKSKLFNSKYFDEFYINFPSNQSLIGINALLDEETDPNTVLIKLYLPLPPQFDIKEEVYITTRSAESLAYEINLIGESDFLSRTGKLLRGPNFNINLKDVVNNSTNFKSKTDLLSTNSSGSGYNLQNILNRSGVKITPNYSYNTFDEFVHFSSAKSRIENFITKLENIESYESDITSLQNITGSTSSSFQTSQSIARLEANISNTIKNFDGYEYYLYYTSGSFTYPKTNSSPPYTQSLTTSSLALNWLGSTDESSAYYGGILLSASFYDSDNQNWLYWTIPEYIKSNSDNQSYIDFSNMVGQHFDEIWLYSKAITEQLNTTNQLDKGVPPSLAEDVLRSFGYVVPGNNYGNINTYLDLLGEDNGSYIPSTGSETINNYIAINNGDVVNYWGSNPTSSFPYAIKDVSEEIFKRLYHNMTYLLKKKGTISGLRSLINIWGIPSSILRISEFGGKDKDNENDYDYWYNRYSYAWSPYGVDQNSPSSSIVVPWIPLEKNIINSDELISPDAISFRFKSFGKLDVTQSLLVKTTNYQTSNSFDFGITLTPSSSQSGSYSGSSNSLYEDWGTLNFNIASTLGSGYESASISLPFYNQEWWTVVIQRNQHLPTSLVETDTTYTLYAKSKNNDQVGWQGSSSLTTYFGTTSDTLVNTSWNSFGTSSISGIYIGGGLEGANINGNLLLNPSGGLFSGSFQEFRYYSYALSESVINNLTMNPESIQGNNVTGSQSSFDLVNFRLPLGNELETLFTSSILTTHTESLQSFHPSVTSSLASLITASFSGSSTSGGYITYYFYEDESTPTYSRPNNEVYYLDQPAVGLKNRISNKIQFSNGNIYGDVLSNQVSIQQNYQISESFNEDVNSLEVAFSPQNEINDDIIQSLGYGAISSFLGDPSVFSSSIYNKYQELEKFTEEYFKKYSKGNIYDYIRLIKYFDTSVFRAIKNYVPARTSVTTGIVVKPHLLERYKLFNPSIDLTTKIATDSSTSFNNPINYEALELTSSINVGSFSGSTGGVVESYNYSGSNPWGSYSITQSYNRSFDTILGSQTIIEDKQREFYDGEYSGSHFKATTQSLTDNPFLEVGGQFYYYDIFFYTSSHNEYSRWILEPTSGSGIDLYAGGYTSETTQSGGGGSTLDLITPIS